MKSYGWQELAILYSPGVSGITASRRLKQWIHTHPTLSGKLSSVGWKPSNRILTPGQVHLIIKHLGEP